MTRTSGAAPTKLARDRLGHDHDAEPDEEREEHRAHEQHLEPLAEQDDQPTLPHSRRVSGGASPAARAASTPSGGALGRRAADLLGERGPRRERRQPADLPRQPDGREEHADDGEPGEHDPVEGPDEPAAHLPDLVREEQERHEQQQQRERAHEQGDDGRRASGSCARAAHRTIGITP